MVVPSQPMTMSRKWMAPLGASRQTPAAATLDNICSHLRFFCLDFYPTSISAKPQKQAHAQQRTHGKLSYLQASGHPPHLLWCQTNARISWRHLRKPVWADKTASATFKHSVLHPPVAPQPVLPARDFALLMPSHRSLLNLWVGRLLSVSISQQMLVHQELTFASCQTNVCVKSQGTV